MKSLFITAAFTASLFSSNLVANPVVGSWKSPCIRAFNPVNEFATLEYTFSEIEGDKGSLDAKLSFYSSEHCDGAALREFITKASYSLGEQKDGYYPLNAVIIDTEEKVFDILATHKDEKGDNYLYLGNKTEGLNATSEEARPTEISYKHYFKKQVEAEKTEETEETSTEK